MTVLLAVESRNRNWQNQLDQIGDTLNILGRLGPQHVTAIYTSANAIAWPGLHQAKFNYFSVISHRAAVEEPGNLQIAVLP